MNEEARTSPQPGAGRKPASKEAQAEATRKRICEAVIRCLDTNGYAGTSINAVQALAGVSRGALTHHFPTRQALVSETANRLLARVLRPARQASAASVEEMILYAWRRIVNTREGRAFVEILIAMRTDRKLNRELAPALARWDHDISRSIETALQPRNGVPGDVAILWSICRTFLRGLVIHERFTGDARALEPLVHRFAAMLAQHLEPRRDENP